MALSSKDVSKSSILLICLFIACFFCGCFNFKQELELHGPRFPIPSKDEVAIVNGRPLTLTYFYSILSQLKNPTFQMAYWISTSSLLLQEKTRTSGNPLEEVTTLTISRYASGDIDTSLAQSALEKYYGKLGKVPAPEQVRADLDALAKQFPLTPNYTLLNKLN